MLTSSNITKHAIQHILQKNKASGLLVCISASHICHAKHMKHLLHNPAEVFCNACQHHLKKVLTTCVWCKSRAKPCIHWFHRDVVHCYFLSIKHLARRRTKHLSHAWIGNQMPILLRTHPLLSWRRPLKEMIVLFIWTHPLLPWKRLLYEIIALFITTHPLFSK